MKKLLATIALGALAVSGAFAQGELIFQNYISAGNPANAPVYTDSTDTTLVSGTGFLADLLYGTSAGTINQDAGFATVFRTAGGAGFFIGGNQTIADSGTVFMRVVVWQAAAGASWAAATGNALDLSSGTAYSGHGGQNWGISSVFSANLPVSPAPPQTLAGIITTFNLVPVPEPTTLALGGLGAAALLLFRRRK